MALFSYKQDKKEYTFFQSKTPKVVEEFSLPTPVDSLKHDVTLIGKVIGFSVHKAITYRFGSFAVAIIACAYFAHYLISTYTSYLVL